MPLSFVFLRSSLVLSSFFVSQASPSILLPFNPLVFFSSVLVSRFFLLLPAPFLEIDCLIGWNVLEQLLSAILALRVPKKAPMLAQAHAHGMARRCGESVTFDRFYWPLSCQSPLSPSNFQKAKKRRCKQGIERLGSPAWTILRDQKRVSVNDRLREQEISECPDPRWLRGFLRLAGIIFTSLHHPHSGTHWILSVS